MLCLASTGTNFGAYFISLSVFDFCLSIRIHISKLGIHKFRFVTKSAVPDHILCLPTKFFKKRGLRTLSCRWKPSRYKNKFYDFSTNWFLSVRFVSSKDGFNNSKRGFLKIFYVLYSTLLNLPPLRFHCVGGCLVRIQNCCDFGIGSQTL